MKVKIISFGVCILVFTLIVCIQVGTGGITTFDNPIKSPAYAATLDRTLDQFSVEKPKFSAVTPSNIVVPKATVYSTTEPAAPTFCPEALTCCPVIPTQCPVGDTYCSGHSETYCPYVMTQCPTGPTYCEVNSSLTSCPAIPTACEPLETCCPVDSTVCPAVLTKCPAVVTRCVATQCPIGGYIECQPPPPTPPAPPPPTVGIEVFAVDKVRLVLPGILLIVASIVGGIVMARRRGYI